MLRLGILMMLLGLVSAVNLIDTHSFAADPTALGGILLSGGLVAVLVALVTDEHAEPTATAADDRRKERTL